MTNIIDTIAQSIVFHRVVEISYQSEWANKTGYHDGLLNHNVVPTGLVYVFTDNYGRRGLVAGGPDGNVVVFQRYLNDDAVAYQLGKNELSELSNVGAISPSKAIWALNELLFMNGLCGLQPVHVRTTVFGVGASWVFDPDGQDSNLPTVPEGMDDFGCAFGQTHRGFLVDDFGVLQVQGWETTQMFSQQTDPYTEFWEGQKSL